MDTDTRPRDAQRGCRPALPVAALLLFAALAACARPLSPNETAFAEALFGETLDAQEVRVWGGFPQAPSPEPAAREATRDEDPPPRRPPAGFCDRVPHEAGETVVAAFVLWDQVWFMHDFYAPDTFAGFPVSLPLPAALIMVHELVHVWQWQNRAVTGYTPTGSASESIGVVDPYFWGDAAAQEFLSYGYEQQAAIIEDYVCYALFDPRAPRYRELRTLLEPVLPVAGFEAALRADRRRRDG